MLMCWVLGFRYYDDGNDSVDDVSDVQDDNNQDGVCDT